MVRPRRYLAGGIDPAACDKLNSLLRYVDGDYTGPATSQALRKELNGAQRPAFYLAIPCSRRSWTGWRKQTAVRTLA